MGAKHEDEVVLFAVLGMSPAVLTETVWALAQEKPPVAPTRVVVLTTTSGRDALARELFAGGEGCGWNRLVRALAARRLPVQGRLRFGLAADHVRLFPNASGTGDLADIASTADNTAAADFILRELRALTEDPSVTTLASIAGGRKTMSALMMSCMCLLGRARDRLLHVLINPPFDGPLTPLFLFPEKGASHTAPDGRVFASSAARVALIDVPFVRMRGWYEGAFKRAPPGYAALVRGVQRQTPEALDAPRLTLDRAEGCVRVEGGETLYLSPTEFGVLLLLCSGARLHQDLADRLAELAARPTTPSTPDWVARFQDGGRFGGRNKGNPDVANARKSLSSARAKIRSHALLADLAERLAPRQGRAPSYPPDRIALTGPDLFAEAEAQAQSGAPTESRTPLPRMKTLCPNR